jgi:choline monooxygenase
MTSDGTTRIGRQTMHEVDFTITSTGNRVATGPLTSDSSQSALIPARAYTSAAAHELERERIFAAGWVWAGYAHWVAEPGQVKPIAVADQPLLMVRAEDGEIRVFHNSCRHRGMALTEEPITVKRRIQCAYHCWSYDLDGSLAVTPYFQRDRQGRSGPVDRRALGLLPVASRVWAGMVFVNLGARDIDTATASFERFIAPLAQRWSHIDFDRIRLAEERVFDVAANWKLVVENFLDFYHLPFIHPQVGPVSSSLDVDDEVLTPEIIGGCYPRGATGKAAKTSDALPFLGEVPREKTESQDIFCVFPNALLFLEADWFQVIGFEALSADRTVEHMAIFVDRDGASEDNSVNRKRLAEVLFKVNEQDLPILEKLQTGRHSPASDRTSLVPHWDQVTAMFQQLVADRVAGPVAQES